MSFLFCVVLGVTFYVNPNETKVNHVSGTFPYYIKFAVIFVILSSLLTISLYGFNLLSINFEETYTVRAQNRGKGVGSVAAYMFTFTLYLLCPLLISYSIINRKKLLFLISIIALFISFFANANKITLLVLLISLIVPFVNMRKINNYIGFFFIVLYGSGVYFFGYVQYDLINFFIGRIFVLPSVSTMFYVEFAASNSYYFFQDWNFIGEAIKELFNIIEYNVPKTFKIGEVYSKWEGNNFNSTMWANGYLDGGFIVVTLFTVIIARVFKYLCNLYTSKPEIITYLFILTILCMEKSMNALLLGAGLIFFPVYNYSYRLIQKIGTTEYNA